MVPDHEPYMQRCLQLAILGAGNVAPNPMVGSVLVHNNSIIGEGYHREFGQAHAEVNCINSVPKALRGKICESTIYVSLEPCTHFGKTPPCTDFIIQHKIPSVVIACKDSFEKVDGSGIQKLKAAGIKVTTGILEREALDLNRRFFTFHKEQRPYIILKWAQSSDLKIANHKGPTKISGMITDRLVHKWRAEESAIMVGTHTAIEDDPHLTTRYWPGKSPVRVVIDKLLKIPQTSHLLDNSIPTIVVNTVKQEEAGNTLYYKTGADEDFLAITVNILRQRNLISLIVEGGCRLLQSFIDKGLWDEIRIITNTKMRIGKGVDAPRILDIQHIHEEYFENDRIQYFRNPRK
jgi:diaminohydroxyphosphoribosylaminopyrimidine deaminase / 5-amino-6-(5-phosphoribosylamino)uracil reductase